MQNVTLETVETAVEQTPAEAQIAELNLFELALVGGGTGAVIFD